MLQGGVSEARLGACTRGCYEGGRGQSATKGEEAESRPASERDSGGCSRTRGAEGEGVAFGVVELVHS